MAAEEICYTVVTNSVADFFFGRRVVMNIQVHQEGELYRVVTTFGKTFELRYGYYDERDPSLKMVGSTFRAMSLEMSKFESSAST